MLILLFSLFALAMYFFNNFVRLCKVLLQFGCHFVEVSVLFSQFINLYLEHLLIGSLFDKLLLVFDYSHWSLRKGFFKRYHIAVLSFASIFTLDGNIPDDLINFFHIILNLIDSKRPIILIFQLPQLFLWLVLS